MNENDAAIERMQILLDELAERLEGDLSPHDELALRAAVSKALVAGWQLGAGHVAWTAALQGVQIEINYLNETDFDLYAETYKDCRGR